MPNNGAMPQREYCKEASVFGGSMNKWANNSSSKHWWHTLVLIPMTLVETQLLARLIPSAVGNNSKGGTNVFVFATVHHLLV